MYFKISEASALDIDDIVNITHLSMQQDPIYTHIFRDVSAEDERRFITTVVSRRFEVPNASTIFKVTEQDKGDHGSVDGSLAFLRDDRRRRSLCGSAASET